MPHSAECDAARGSGEIPEGCCIGGCTMTRADYPGLAAVLADLRPTDGPFDLPPARPASG